LGKFSGSFDGFEEEYGWVVFVEFGEDFEGAILERDFFKV
jgi:hypothetical protein